MNKIQSIKFWREKGTVALIIKKSANGVVKTYTPLIQFTTKDMWLLPKHENTSVRNLWGWMFFYFGYIHTTRQMI